MKINWKLRLKNKTTLTTLVGITVSFVYQILGLFDVTTPISQDQVIQYAGLVLNALAYLGVLVDPTTTGVSDSQKALTYKEPN